MAGTKKVTIKIPSETVMSLQRPVANSNTRSMTIAAMFIEALGWENEEKVSQRIVGDHIEIFKVKK